MSDAEVHNLNHRPTVNQHHITRLEVAVNDALQMGILEGTANLHKNLCSKLNREFLPAADLRLQRLSPNQFHCVVRGSLKKTGLEDLDNVGMSETSADLDLTHESLTKLHIVHVLFANGLERHNCIILPRLVDHCHSASANLSDGVMREPFHCL